MLRCVMVQVRILPWRFFRFQGPESKSTLTFERLDPLPPSADLAEAFEPRDSRPTPGDMALAGTFGGGPGSAPGERRCSRCEDEFIFSSFQLYRRSRSSTMDVPSLRRPPLSLCTASSPPMTPPSIKPAFECKRIAEQSKETSYYQRERTPSSRESPQLVTEVRWRCKNDVQVENRTYHQQFKFFESRCRGARIRKRRNLEGHGRGQIRRAA